MPFTTMGVRNTVPSNMARMVPLGLFHISFNLYSSILAALGVMVAHFTATSMIHYMLKLLRLSPQKLYRKTKKLSMKYNDDNNKRLDFFCNTNYMWEILHVKDLYPLRKVEFEGMEVNVPNRVDKYLMQHYGDYMQLPPEEKRKNHYPYRLNFGEYSSHAE